MKGLIFLGSLDRAYNYQKAVRSRTDFRIYDGEESHFLGHPSSSGVVSIGANLAPGAWQKITTSSLNLNGNQENYPDYLKQIWKIGGYLSNLKDIYHEIGAPLVKQILADIGIIQDPTSTIKAEYMDEKVDALKKLMRQHGDYS